MEKWIDKANEIHNGEYCYDLVNFKRLKDKVEIICREHGVFIQTMDNHISRKSKCPKCAIHNRSMLRTEKDIVSKFNTIHFGIYDYSKVNYISSSDKVEIICREHGSFFQTPNNHLSKKHICPTCSNLLRNKDQLKSISEVLCSFDEVWGNRYDYSRFVYMNSKTKSEIICNKHGVFKQSYTTHLKCGCPKCNSSKGEMFIENYLLQNGVSFINQHSFIGCINKRRLKFDFYLPDYNICIEFDGIQHFKANTRFGYDSFEKNIINDNIKNEWCLNNDVKLVRIKYSDNILDKLLNININI